MLYRLILKIRNRRYRDGNHSVKAEVPTICVGNITVGGTGKTPHTEMILRMLLESDEWGARNIAVLSRGYKRESRGFQQVTMEGLPSVCGDEPLQIKKKFPGVVVAVDKDRVEGCDFLVHPEKLAASRSARRCLHKEMPAAELIVLDDAFQYRRLKADLNIVLVDYNRPVHEDRLLPFGRLRDLPERLGDADIIIVTKCPSELDNWEKTEFVYKMGFSDFQTSSCEGTAPDGKKQTVLFTTVRYARSVPVYEFSDPRYIYSKQVILFTGIAGDTPLRCYLSDRYKIVKHFRFPDHHKYKKSDFAQIKAALKQYPTAALATTEKDSQRVMELNGLPQIITGRMFMVPITVDFLSDGEREKFRTRLLSV